MFAPRETQSVENVGIGDTGLVVQYLDNVSGRAARSCAMARVVAAADVALPQNGVVKLVSAGGGTDAALLSFESLTAPPTLHYVTETNDVENVQSLHRRPTMQVTSWFSSASRNSRDGTRIPYFVMGRKAVLARGNAPTVQYAYGGFLSPTLPVYYEDPSRPQHGALAGKLWVSRGGVLVLCEHSRRIGIRPALAPGGSA